MRTAAAAFALLVTFAVAASADGHSSNPIVRHIARGAFHAGASGDSGVAPHLGASGSSAPGLMASRSTFFAHPRAFIGGGSRLQARSSSFWSNGSAPLTVSHWMFSREGMERVDPTSGSGSGQTQQLPPGSFGTVPGALLRSEGVGFLYAPGDSGRFTSVEAGNRIAVQDNLAAPTSGRGVYTMPPDKLPGANGQASGVTAITPNAPASNDSSSITSNDTTINNSSIDSSLSNDIHDYGNHNGNGNGNTVP